MKLFDCLGRKNSGISVYGPMSIAACIFLVISFLTTSSYAFASEASQAGIRTASTPRHSVTGNSEHVPAKGNTRLNNADWALTFGDEFDKATLNTSILIIAMAFL